MEAAPTLHLLKAEDLPVALEAVRAHSTIQSGQALAAIRQTTGGQFSDEEILGRVEFALTRLRPPGRAVGYSPEDIARLPEDRYEEHDLYFGAVRIGGQPTEVFTRTLLEAYRGHLRDAMGAQVAFVADQRGHLSGALDASFALLRSCDPRSEPDVRPVEVRPVLVAPVEVDPLLRWKLGHQMFFALIQSLIVTLGCAANALARQQQGVPELIDTATVVMRGSAAALRYAADFSPIGYSHGVRPTMMPPRLEPKFSGLQLRDHRYLIKVVTQVKSMIVTADVDVQGRYRRFVAAMADAYDEHKLVCARFGGTTEPSLRMNAGATMSAVEALDRLKNGRLRMAGR